MIGLVLGGGGVVGIAWEIGVLAGLEEACGFQPNSAEVIVGTSAGSFVGARVRQGASTQDLLASQEEQMSGVADRPIDLQPDLEKVMEIFRIWAAAQEMTPEVAREVGAKALEAPTPSEESWVGSFEKTLGDGEWPEQDLLITAVSCVTGERVVWKADSGVGLARAVASSCTVPGLFPPVEIHGTRYVDGGVWSASNADLVLGQGIDQAIFIGPLVGEQGILGISTRALKSELEALSEAGISLLSITPGPEFAAIGINLMDPSLRKPGLDVGRQDGERAAAEVEKLLAPSG